MLRPQATRPGGAGWAGGGGSGARLAAGLRRRVQRSGRSRRRGSGRRLTGCRAVDEGGRQARRRQLLRQRRHQLLAHLCAHEHGQLVLMHLARVLVVEGAARRGGRRQAGGWRAGGCAGRQQLRGDRAHPPASCAFMGPARPAAALGLAAEWGSGLPYPPGPAAASSPSTMARTRAESQPCAMAAVQRASSCQPARSGQRAVVSGPQQPARAPSGPGLPVPCAPEQRQPAAGAARSCLAAAAPAPALLLW
jgi:hypothetical protein